MINFGKNLFSHEQKVFSKTIIILLYFISPISTEDCRVWFIQLKVRKNGINRKREGGE